MASRQVPLIVVASASSALADSVARQLRLAGNVVYIAHSAQGCLRVATSVAPDVVLVDPKLRMPKRFEALIKAHPASAGTQVLHLTEATPPTFELPHTFAAA